MIILAAIVFFIWQNSYAVIKLLYPEKYIAAFPFLPMLTLSLTFFTLLSIIATILNADARPGLSFRIALIAVIFDFFCNLFLVPKYGTAGAALSTGIASLIGLLIGGYFV